ncbi:UTP--glucose-1-phosphate uridylyltransferase [Candidatus Babeliales bacterium]|nr:UTP--glucose-1-phosphate uridylyltransferase [Candidatus Babeliales bacterium]
MDINKVIIPAAGLGTRFLPYSKSVPKEMLPLLNKPAIHYIVQEAFESGIKHLSLVTNRSKHSIEDYFDTSPELSHILKDLGEKNLLNDIEKIIRSIDFTSVRQHEMMGLGHALWLARHSIGKEYCGVMLPDDIIFSKQPALAQLIRIARQEKASIIAVQEVPADCLSSYGVVTIKKQITPHLLQISSIIEKPDQKDAPSNLAVIGRYVLSHKIFNALDQMTTYSVGEELQLSDAINNMIQNNEKVFAYKVQGIRYDIGTPIGWIKAVIGSALQDPQYGPHIQRFIDDLGTSESFLFNQSKNIQHTV